LVKTDAPGGRSAKTAVGIKKQMARASRIIG
jgi:hypothetical protein